MQVDLAANGTPTIEEWAGVAADSAAELVSTERGCLLARLLWEYDCVLHPDAFEEFLASGHPVAIDWQKAIEVTFPELPPIVAVGRNLVMVRMVEWLISRGRAAKVLAGTAGAGAQGLEPRGAARRPVRALAGVADRAHHADRRRPDRRVALDDRDGRQNP